MTISIVIISHTCNPKITFITPSTKQYSRRSPYRRDQPGSRRCWLSPRKKASTQSSGWSTQSMGNGNSKALSTITTRSRTPWNRRQFYSVSTAWTPMATVRAISQWTWPRASQSMCTLWTSRTSVVQEAKREATLNPFKTWWNKLNSSSNLSFHRWKMPRIKRFSFRDSAWEVQFASNLDLDILKDMLGLFSYPLPWRRTKKPSLSWRKWVDL